MKIDLYTKSVLTLIAAALVFLSAQSTMKAPIVLAQESRPQRVVITGVENASINPIYVRVLGGTKYGNLVVDDTNPLPVHDVSK